jgi:hypothetical protein
MAYVEVCQPSKREIGDDSAKPVDVSRMLAWRLFLLRDQNKLTLRDQQCAGGSNLSLKCVENSRPAYGGR